MIRSITPETGGDEVDPYLQSIVNMAEMEFPGAKTKDRCAVFEAVSEELVGTKQHRFGPTPSPESLVAIREVVLQAINAGKPIPILIPWGGSKQGPWDLDIAEVMALKQVKCLIERVRHHYEPGVDVRIRLEDLTDNVMFADVPGWSAKTKRYTDTFSNLHDMLMPSQSMVMLESRLVDPKTHANLVEFNGAHILKVLDLPEDQRESAIKHQIPDWSGSLPDEQLDFYRRAYIKFYPDETNEQRDARLATYFGSAIARFMLGSTGAAPYWGKYITLAFTGIPWSKAGRRIYYRSIPERYTNQHRAPWIGKGYVRINGRTATPAIAGFNGDGLNFVPARLRFVSDFANITVDADYVVED